MDWTNLLSNTLWIAALALVLAVVGYTRWRAKNAGIAVRTAIQNVGTQFGLNLAGLLFSLGLAISGQVWWLRLMWLLAAGWFAARMFGSRMQKGNPQRQDHGID